MDLRQMRRVIMAQEKAITRLCDTLVENLPAIRSKVETIFEDLHKVVSEAQQEDRDLSMRGLTPDYRIRDFLGIKPLDAPVDQYHLVETDNVLTPERIVSILRYYFAPNSTYSENGGVNPLPDEAFIRNVPTLHVDSKIDNLEAPTVPTLLVSVDHHDNKHMLLLRYQQGIHQAIIPIISVYYDRLMDTHDLKSYGGITSQVHDEENYYHRGYALLSVKAFDDALVTAMRAFGSEMYLPPAAYDEDDIMAHLNQHPDTPTEGTFTLPNGKCCRMGIDRDAFRVDQKLVIWVTDLPRHKQPSPGPVEVKSENSVARSLSGSSFSFSWPWDEAPLWRQWHMATFILSAVESSGDHDEH